MAEFLFFFEKGLRHILNLFAYDHILFLVALSIPYAFKDWKRLFILITLFTVGHTIALFLSNLGIVILKTNSIEFLIPITILIIAFFNLFTAGKSSKQESIGVSGFITLFFGIIHGLSFSEAFNLIAKNESKTIPMLEYSVGIEASQIIVIIIALIVSYIVQTIFRFSKRDWTLAMSAFIIGVVLPLIIQSEIWKR